MPPPWPDPYSDPNPYPDPSPYPDPIPNPAPHPECRSKSCFVGPDLRSKFPDLNVRPRPEPSQNNPAEHAVWKREFEQWGGLHCGCGKGYFCREHGDWISGPEVSQGAALPRVDQKKGSCPAYHYQGPNGRDSYVGERDGHAA